MIRTLSNRVKKLEKIGKIEKRVFVIIVKPSETTEEAKERYLQEHPEIEIFRNEDHVILINCFA